MGFFKKKNEKEQQKEPKEAPPPKASPRQLLRYASTFDKVLFAVGSIVAIGTGFGFPLLAIIIGNVSQSFVDAQILYNQNSVPPNEDTTLAPDVTLPPVSTNFTWEKFSDQVITNCLNYVWVGIAMFVAATTQVICYLVACENLNHRLRREFFKAVLRQDITWFDMNQSGTLTTKLFDNLERVKEGTGDKVALLIQFTSQFFAGFVVAFIYDWRLTLIMMSLSPFMIACGAFMAKLMASASAKEAKNYASAGAVAEEVLTSMRTVIAFNGQEYECARYDKALEGGLRDGILKSLYVGIGLGLTFLIIFGSYCLAFWVGTDYVHDGVLDAGTVLTVFFGVMMGSMALGQAGPQFAVLGTGLGAAGTIMEVIEREPEIDAYDPSGDRPKDMKGRIELKGISFSYPTRPDIQILNGISFEVNPGETVALVGSSGCGKSTVVSLLLRYYNPQSGKIMIDGHDISSLNLEYLRNMIGVVSQEPVLFNTTIAENIRMGKESLNDGEMIAACRKANAENFINQLPNKYQTVVGDRGTQMSGGQKQRIAIARALVRNPKILLLDEATSALDAESESIVQKALEQAAQGRTTLIIAHRLSTIKNADKIIAMKDGEVVEVGTHEELIKAKGFYYDLVNAQVFADIDDNSGASAVDRKLARRTSSVYSRRSRLSSTASEKDHPLSPRFTTSEVKSDAQQAPQDIKKETERLKKEMEEEGATESNLLAILKYAKPELFFIVFGMLMCLVQGCVFPAFSLFFSQILDVFAKPPDEMKKQGHFWALMFLVLGVVQGITMLFQAFFFGLSAERLTKRLRSLVFRTVMRMDVGYFDMPNHSSGKIATRLATDTPNVKSAIDYRLGSVLTCIVSIGCGIGIAFYFGWQMALLVIAIFPLGGVGQALQLKYIEGRHRKDARDLADSGKVALEAIENIRTVQALTLEKKFHSLFCHFLNGPHETSTRKAIIQGICYGFSSSIFFFLYSSAFRFGLFLIMDSILAPMNVMRVLFAVSFTAGSLGFASAYFPEYAKAKFAAGIIFKMLDEEPKIDSLTTGGAKPNVSGEVDFSNLHFAYPQRPAVRILKGLDLNVGVGQTLAIVGPSGCGKSTVVCLLERFYDPLDGEVTIDSHDVRSMNPQHLRSQMGLVSQEPILFDCSIRDNILYGLPPNSVTEEEIMRVAQEANIHKFISELPDGYNTRVGEKGTQLSGGQKQRIAIARALIRNPKILLLDEATSALDTESEKVVQEALDRARKGRTCIVVAHRLSTIVNADCIAVVKNGIVLEKGTHAELMKLRGAYYALTQKQNMKTSGAVEVIENGHL